MTDDMNSILENDIVTVSKVQVALRANARSLQRQLSDLSLQAETTTAEGLWALLQQATIALLDQAAEWTHGLVRSYTLTSREAAESEFEQLSIRERSKFSVETLTNVDGVVRTQPIVAPDPDEKPAYIVVTLLLGTADDRPLFEAAGFGKTRSATALRSVLEEMHALPLVNLLVLELLWTPQDEHDCLTEQDLANDFPDLVALQN